MRDVCQFVLTLTAASVPSGQVQVVGGLQSPQGPFRPLPRKSPRLQHGKINRDGRGWNMSFFHHVLSAEMYIWQFYFVIVVPSAQVQVVGRTPAPQGFLLGNVIILNIIVNLSILKIFISIIVNIINLTILIFSTWIPLRQHNHLMDISIPINIVNTASIWLSSSSTIMMTSSPSSRIVL